MSGFTAASFSCRNDPSFILVPCFVGRGRGAEGGYRCTPDDAPETEPSPLDRRMDEADAKPPPPPSTLPLMQETVLILSLQMELLAAALKPGLEGLFFFSPFHFSCSSRANGKSHLWHVGTIMSTYIIINGEGGRLVSIT